MALKLANEKKRKILLLLLIILLIVGTSLIIVEFLTWGGSASQSQNQNSNQTSHLTITIDGPFQWPNNSNFDYTITLHYDYSAQDIITADKLDPLTQPVDSSPTCTTWKKYTYDPLTNTITWKMSDNVTPGSGKTFQGPIVQKFTFTVKPLTADTYVFNLGVTAQVVGS